MDEFVALCGLSTLPEPEVWVAQNHPNPRVFGILVKWLKGLP